MDKLTEIHFLKELSQSLQIIKMTIYRLHKLLVLKGDPKTDIVHSIVIKLAVR
jgi:hypothetical protein